MAKQIRYQRCLINALVGLFTLLQCLSPVVLAQAALDLDPPSITHVVPTEFKSGSEITVEATVTDDNGIEEVVVFYRIAPQGPFIELPMTNIGGSEYSAVLQTEKSQGVLQYYIEAVDLGKNRLVEGSPAAPLVVDAIAGNKGKSNILYIVLGAIALGGLVAAAGGGSDDGGDSVSAGPNTTPLTITVPTP